jgi:CHAT domain-containing protein
VPAEGRFKLTAHATEERRESPIYLTFYRGNLPVGQLTILTVIDPVHEVRSASISVPFGGAPDPDYVLVVTDRSDSVKGAGPFDISVSKEGQFLNKPLGAFPVTVDAWEYASRRLDGFRRVKDEVAVGDRIRAAEMLGVELWNDLPETFQRFYWEELHDHPGASIAIYSQEPYIPWELIKPQRAPGDADGFLGTVFNIARWKQATRFPDPLTVSRFSIIAPVYTAESGSRPLPGAQVEADELVASFGAVKVPGDRATVRALLESNEGIQLIHFAGHGDFDPQNTAAMTIIRLSDAPLVPGDLTQAVLGRASRPFVFLNACEVGEQGWALTRIGGWAEAFTDVGFSGFVGPYWAVSDRVARKAAMLFYHSLAAGLTVGEAIRQIRLRFYSDDEQAGHPSWLAYTLHCQPNIRISLTQSAAQPVAPPVAPGVGP